MICQILKMSHFTQKSHRSILRKEEIIPSNFIQVPLKFLLVFMYPLCKVREKKIYFRSAKISLWTPSEIRAATRSRWRIDVLIKRTLLASGRRPGVPFRVSEPQRGEWRSILGIDGLRHRKGTEGLWPAANNRTSAHQSGINCETKPYWF